MGGWIKDVIKNLNKKVCLTCKKREAIHFGSQECYECDLLSYKTTKKVTNTNKSGNSFKRYSKAPTKPAVKRNLKKLIKEKK